MDVAEEEGGGAGCRVPEDCCAETAALIKACLSSDFRQRPTAIAVVRKLEQIVCPAGPAWVCPTVADSRGMSFAPSRPRLPTVVTPFLEQARGMPTVDESPRVELDSGWAGASSVRNPFKQINLAHSSMSSEVNLRKRSLGPARSFKRSDSL